MIMKKTIQLMIAGALVLGAVSCAKEIASEENSQPSGPVTLTATIVDESGTKATLNDVTGAFAFSGTDAIKVYNGSACYESTGVSIKEGIATFTMADGFTNTGSGFAGFPASMVSNITASGVTFVLPASYTYSQVGGSNASAAMVPCPMMATYTAEGNLQFRQAGSVVRIRVTNIAAGTLSFTFPSNVTGKVKVSTTPSGNSDGITTLSSEVGHTITVTDVPNISMGNYAYITLPVPTNTKPQNILVVNNPSDASDSRMAAIEGSATSLNRAGGYKLSVSPVAKTTPSFKVGPSTTVVLAPGNLMAHVANYEGGATATADSWKFGGYFECIGYGGGNSSFASGTSFTDKWIDLFSWQGQSADTKAHGLVNVSTSQKAYNGNVEGESLYSGCWDGLTIVNCNTSVYTWRPMKEDELSYLLTNASRGAKVNGNTYSRHVRATVAGVNGLLIFPDSDSEIWTSAMGEAPTCINTTGSYSWGSTNNYTASNFEAMYSAGIIFLPTVGVRVSGNIDRVATCGVYWASKGEDTTHAYATYFDGTCVLPCTDGGRHSGRAVRLVRDVE